MASIGDSTWTSPITGTQIKIYFDDNQDDNADLDLILQAENGADEDIIRSKAILLQTEPELNHGYYQKDDYLYTHSFEFHPMYLNWHVNLSYQQLTQSDIERFQKTKRLSCIVSSKYFYPGHRKRTDFIKYCQLRDPTLFDVYGYTNDHHLTNYLGPLPVGEKDQGLIPYKYTFNAENNAIPNYFTEKILDAILTETVCFIGVVQI